jgi:SagB-type dehydrogenase family enzyme
VTRAAAAALKRLTARLPAVTKSYPGKGRIPLPPPRLDAAGLVDTLVARRTWRRFGRRPMSLQELGTLLGLTWRVQRWAEAKDGATVALKTSPSFGALHPGEVYVAAFKVAGLARGLYHYDAAAHHLTRVDRRPKDFAPSRYAPQQPWYRGASALMLMTAVLERETWKYPSPRAYRVLLAPTPAISVRRSAWWRLRLAWRPSARWRSPTHASSATSASTA